MPRIKKPRWKLIAMEELRRLWAQLEKIGPIVDGTTRAALQQTYGKENIKHVYGKGFYKFVR